MPTIGEAAGVYEPFFGAGLRSWDDSREPLGQRYHWGHIQLAIQDEDFAIPDGWSMVVLRPTATMNTVVDTLAAADQLSKVSVNPYSQPFAGVFLQWLKWNDQGANWYDADAQQKSFWASAFGVDPGTLVAPTKLQFAPALDTASYTNISEDPFWLRDIDCSSLAMWSLIWGWYQTDPTVAAFFQDNLGAVAAIDALAPGQMAWWLQDVGYTTRVY